MQVFRFGFPLELFSAAPRPHRLGYLMLGQLWNDTVVLNKQMLQAKNRPSGGLSSDDEHAQIAVEFLNLRLLASRLHEGGRLLQNLGRFSKEWKHELSPEAVSGATSVLKYFANGNAPLSRLRNKIGFHQDFTLAEQAIDTVADPELFDYRGEHIANVIYISAEILTLRSLAILFGVETARQALDVLAADVVAIIGWTFEVCQGYHDWFLSSHILPHHPLTEGRMRYLDSPLFENVVTPFFADMAGMAERVAGRASESS